MPQAILPISLLLALFSLSALVSFGCADKEELSVSLADCQRVQDHMADLRVAGFRINDNVDPKRAAVERAKHRANFASAGGEAALESCAQERTPQWVDCALAAKSLQEAKECS